MNAPEKVVFAVSFEAMFVRALGKPPPRDFELALEALKVDLTHLQVAYPLQTWKDTLAAARRVLHPNLNDDAAYENLGRVFIRSYFDTLIGRAIQMVLKAIGPARSLERMRQNFRSGNNFWDSTLEKTGDKQYLLHINEDLGHPSFILGIIHEGMTFAVEPSFRMSVVKTTPPTASYACAWG